MRIVGGRFRGRRIASPTTITRTPVRPTSERLREAIASALEARSAIQNAVVLDLFAGTGALGLEALSRGASHVTFVDRDRQLLQHIRTTAQTFGVDTAVQTIALDLLADPRSTAARLASTGPYDLVFADPPYDEIDQVPPLLTALPLAGEHALIALEHATRKPPAELARLRRVASYRGGDSTILLLALDPPAL